MLRKIFDVDNSFMRGLSRVTDLVVLNVLFILCSIPVVTLGASLAALYSMTLKMVKNEEPYIVQGFFKAFRENLKQGIIFGISGTVILAIVCVNLTMFRGAQTGMFAFIKIACYAVIVWLVLAALYIFPIVARFQMGIAEIFKNAFLICVANFAKTLMMLAMYIPVWILMFYSEITMYVLMSIFVVFGFSVLAFCQSFILRKIFAQYEPEEAEEENIDI